MANDSEDPEGAAARLEAALERIAQAAAREAAPAVTASGSQGSEVIAVRLDALIDRLRAALGGKAD